MFPYFSHCADAVLSLANQMAIVADVSATLLDFVACWVQTSSDYDVLVANTVGRDWARKHMPVLSRHGNDPTRYTVFIPGTPGASVPITSRHEQDDHILYTPFSLGQPAGRAVLCHLRCGQEVQNKQGNLFVRLICKGCGSWGSIDQFKTDQTTMLGKYGLVAVKYPQDQHPVDWTTPKDKIPKATPLPPSASCNQAHEGASKFVTHSSS